MITIYTPMTSSKNTMVFSRNKNYLFKTSKTQSAEKFLQQELTLPENHAEWDRMLNEFPFPIELSVKFYRKTKGRFDYHNMIHGLLDIMIKVGYIPDDSFHFVKPRFEWVEFDKENPRTVITITGSGYNQYHEALL